MSEHVNYALFAHDAMVDELIRKDAAIAELVAVLEGVVCVVDRHEFEDARDAIAKYDIPKAES